MSIHVPVNDYPDSTVVWFHHAAAQTFMESIQPDTVKAGLLSSKTTWQN